MLRFDVGNYSALSGVAGIVEHPCYDVLGLVMSRRPRWCLVSEPNGLADNIAQPLGKLRVRRLRNFARRYAAAEAALTGKIAQNAFTPFWTFVDGCVSYSYASPRGPR